MDVLWTVLVILLITYADADSDADSKWIVRVPYIHAEDVPVVGNFRNFARLNWNVGAANVSSCVVERNLRSIFYIRDMSLMKKSCASTECSMTCPSPSCLPVGITVTVYVRCRSERYKFNWYRVRVMSNSSLLLLNCPTLSISSGFLTTKDTRHCSRSTISCQTGYTLAGSSSVSCCNGTWLPNPPACMKDCNRLDIAKGTLSTDSKSHGTIVGVTCDEGYTLSGRSWLICSHGDWSKGVPTCHEDKNTEVVLYLTLSLVALCVLSTIFLILYKHKQIRKCLRDSRKKYGHLVEMVQPDVNNSTQVNQDANPDTQISRVPPVGREN